MNSHLAENPSGIFIFTDLDGTLLGHHDYQYQPVLPLIKQLQTLRIPLFLNSSKTFAEMSEWLDKLGLPPPFIAENGGVIYFSATDPQQKRLLGTDYRQIRELLQRLRDEHGFKFKGFGDSTIEEVMAATALNRDSAQKAMQRAVTEPITWLDSMPRLQAFTALLQKQGLQLQKGGRFYHVMAHHDKASALKWVVEQSLKADASAHNSAPLPIQVTANSAAANLAQTLFGKSPWVIALGDGGNDKQMLQEADLGFILPAASGDNLCLEQDSVFVLKQAAPLGWVAALQTHLLQPLQQQAD